MPTLHTIPHAHLTTEQAREILALCSDAYEEDFTPEFRRLGAATHLIAEEAGRIVSHAAWVPRELRVGATRRPLQCAYIEAVATPVALQRQGFGSIIMRAIPPLLGEFDIAALSPSEPDFYARCGWELWAGPLYHLEHGRRIDSGDEVVMIHRLPRTPPDLDLSAALETDWREGDVW